MQQELLAVMEQERCCVSCAGHIEDEFVLVFLCKRSESALLVGFLRRCEAGATVTAE